MLRRVFRFRDSAVGPVPSPRPYKLELLTTAQEVYASAEFETYEKLLANTFVCQSAAMVWGSRATGPNRSVVSPFTGGPIAVVSTNTLKINLTLSSPI